MQQVTSCLLVALSLAPTGIARAQATAEALAARGDSALDRNDPAAALAAFDAALRQRPDEPTLLQRRGRALRELGKLDDALAAYDRAIAADSGFGPAYAGRAYTRLLLGDLDETLRDVARARAVGLEDPQLALIAGMALVRLGRLAESETELDTFVAAVPGVPDGWYFRAIARARQGKESDALPDLDRAEAAGMSDPRLYAFRAEVQVGLGNRDAACTDLRRAVDAGYVEARTRLAELCK